MGFSIAEQFNLLDSLTPMRIDILIRISLNPGLSNDIRLIALSLLIYNNAVDFSLLEDILLQMKMTEDLDTLYEQLKLTMDAHI
ncbi:hypothetical protein DEAC_c23840 [Desulfosporosinus acididurans]|uniref:Uncharacterized protein n=1 Tax=Desulfosporosinus acididurans TaxID=476652 RepID=A0A0J1FQI4_9FIRM|nr:hypothetical protein [Desulfosporosinus acididurans]KLU65754.1 hypothetical protein DEAC_c23840 [Desulfosporosinus acididurans]